MTVRVILPTFQVCRRIGDTPGIYMWGAVGCRHMAQIREFLSLHVSHRTVAVFWLRERVFVAAHVTEWVSVAARPAAGRCERTVSWNESDT